MSHIFWQLSKYFDMRAPEYINFVFHCANNKYFF